MKNEKELRYFAVALEDAAEAEPRKLVGYAAVFNSESRDLGGFVEKIEAGAFKRSLESGKDIKALFNHDYASIIGRVKNGTLTLREDERGLRVEITPPNTDLGNDVLKLVRDGYIDNMSFGFRVKQDEWRTAPDGTDLRVLKDVDLIEVSVVSEPAYLDTSVAARSLEKVKAEAGRLQKLKERLEICKKKSEDINLA